MKNSLSKEALTQQLENTKPLYQNILRKSLSPLETKSKRFHSRKFQAFLDLKGKVLDFYIQDLGFKKVKYSFMRFSNVLIRLSIFRESTYWMDIYLFKLTASFSISGSLNIPYIQALCNIYFHDPETLWYYLGIDHQILNQISFQRTSVTPLPQETL